MRFTRPHASTGYIGGDTAVIRPHITPTRLPPITLHVGHEIVDGRVARYIHTLTTARRTATHILRISSRQRKDPCPTQHATHTIRSAPTHGSIRQTRRGDHRASPRQDRSRSIATSPRIIEVHTTRYAISCHTVGISGTLVCPCASHHHTGITLTFQVSYRRRWRTICIHTTLIRSTSRHRYTGLALTLRMSTPTSSSSASTTTRSTTAITRCRCKIFSTRSIPYATLRDYAIPITGVCRFTTRDIG